MNKLERLRHVTWEEMSWRGAAAARAAGQRITTRVRPPRWDRADIARALRPDLLTTTQDAIKQQDWVAVHEAIAAAVRARPVHIALDPSTAADVRTAALAATPAARTDAAERARPILGRQYDVLGYRRVSFADPKGGVDWHRDPVHNRRAPLKFWADVPYLDPSLGDHKIIWELNRHQHWLALGRACWLTGDQRYAQAIVDELETWLAANPPLLGINWASMLEVGLRALAWTWAMHFVLATGCGLQPSGASGASGTGSPQPVASSHEPWLVDMLVALDRQLTHVEHNLSYYFSPNTHLTGEALALYVVGTALPELDASPRWVATGRRILVNEIDRQINADGGHAERSTHYQRYTLDFYLLALQTAARAGDGAAPRFAEAATRLAEFTLAMADDGGRLPLIGDDDGGMLWPMCGRDCNDVRDSLALAAVLLDRPDLAPWGLQEEVIWITGRSNPKSQIPNPKLKSRLFPDTGYLICRDEDGGHLVFDVGAHGYMNGGHAHADALAVTLNVEGRPLLIDPGTATYTVNPRLRDRMRGTANHNTVTIDGAPQSEPAGPFQWRTHADAELHGWHGNPAFDWAEASHDGYPGAQHRRSVLRTSGGGWLIVDEILGSAPHKAAAHWHFDPAWIITGGGPGRLRATHLDGHTVWMLHDRQNLRLLHGDEETGLGWYSPVYGTLIPTWSAQMSRTGTTPFSMVTWIGPAFDPDGEPPSLTRITPDCDSGGSDAIAVCVSHGDHRAVTLMRPGEPAERGMRACTLPDYQTNARVLHYSAEDDSVRTLDLVDASHALALRDGWLSLDADDRIPDLRIGVAHGAIDLWASTPPSRLQLQGLPIDASRAVRLNGREAVSRARHRRDMLVVLAADWGDIERSGVLKSSVEPPFAVLNFEA